MKRWPLRCALLLALSLDPLGAADVESLHTFNFNFSLRRGWSLVLHTRVRTFDDLSSFHQFRAGPILEWKTAPRLTALVGYYFTERRDRPGERLFEEQRIWGGGEYSLFESGGWEVAERLLAERFFRNAGEDFWRWRARTEVIRSTPIADLYASGEALRSRGSFIGRYRAGLEWKLHKSVTLATGYEFRDAASGPGSHVIATGFEWDVR